MTHANTPLLNDELISLRAPEPSDLDALYRWENDTRLWSVGRAVAPYSRAQLEAYIKNYDADLYAERQLRLIVVEQASGAAVGAIDLYDFDPVNLRAGVGIITDSQYANRGYATRALALLERYSRERLGLHQLWAVVPDDNEHCRALFAAAGYSTAGHLRSWIRIGNRCSSALVFQHLL